MSPLDQLFLLSFVTLIFSLLFMRWKETAKVLTGLYGLQLIALFLLNQGEPGPAVSSIKLAIMGQNLSWQMDGLSWYFAAITLMAALLTSWYGAGDWRRQFSEQGGKAGLLQVALASNVLAMLVLLASGDLLSLFIGWEMVSWASFLIMAVAGGKAIQAALRYLTYAMAGAMAMLAALIWIWSIAGSLEFSALTSILASLNHAELALLMLLMGSGFAVKMGLIPFHLWQAGAYAEVPGPGAAFLGAISARMGLFTMILLLVKWIGISQMQSVSLPYTFLDAREVWAWIAVVTIILPTYTALKQNDARYLLAWHGIGQGGYMLLGLMTGSALGSAGGLLHVLNYASYQAVLMMAVFAVRYRTGTSDLNALGGLITRMPLSFFALLTGIIGLAGMPPTNGFVSKWMIYRALIEEGMPLLFVASVVGTLGTILSVYKLIHNMFLGQLRKEHVEVREAPWSMVLPMLVLMGVIISTGVAPGLVLPWVAQAQLAVGLPVLDFTLGGVTQTGGSLDMLWVVGVLFAGFGIGAILFYSAGKTRTVHQLDNYAGGHFLTAETHYHYSDNFYAGLMHHIGGWYRGSFTSLENGVKSFFNVAAEFANGAFRIIQPAWYALILVVIGLSAVISMGVK